MIRRPVQPLAKPFSWLPVILENNSDASFVSDAMDAWRGVETCLELVNISELDRRHAESADDDDPEVSVLLNVNDTECLMRLAIVTAKTWSLKCEKHLSRMEEQATRQARGGAK